MKENLISIILGEYYQIISPLLAYASCEKTDRLERNVLSLLCAAKGCQELEADCWTMIDNAKCLQSSLDGALLLSTDLGDPCIACDIKMDVLTACQIGKPRNFEETTFIENLKILANAGHKNSCKLLSFLNWLGLMIPENKNAAKNIWSVLAVSGDRLAIEMLIFGCESTGESEKWSHIYSILQREQENFSAIASCLNYPEYTEEEVQLANIILFISQKNAGNTAPLNRPMLHYVLHSKDDYAAKMRKLSTETNYYLVMHVEDTYSQKEFGF